MKKLIIILFLTLPLSAVANDAQRKAYLEALEAANKNDLITFEALAAGLKNYVLYPYVEYHRLKVRFNTVQKSQIDAFLKKYPNQPIANHLKLRWVQKLMAAGQYAVAAGYNAPQHLPTLRCNILAAKIKSGIDAQYLLNQDLWLYGKSRPDACDPVFAYWKAKGYIGPIAYGKRAILAIAAKQSKLAQKLAQKADSASKFFVIGHVQKKQAISQAKSFIPGSYAILASLPKSLVDNEVRSWKARQFIYSGDWSGLQQEISKMPVSQQNKDMWQYWAARSYAKLGNIAMARELYNKAAKNSSFYGFLSADILGINYSICTKTSIIDKDTIYAKYPELQRAFELRLVGYDYFAGSEWNNAIRRMPKDDIIKASILAARQGWYIKSILELGKIREFQYYAARFPLLYKDSIVGHSRKMLLDPAFTYGIARTESALRADAKSPVGARGLMQLMPATARSVAKKYGLATPSNSSLLQPDYNISLGTGYLNQMSGRWAQQLILMIASYNAGPHRAEQWIAKLPHEADRFIATIPFNETRKYVTRVLDYTTMYNWVLGTPVKRIGGRISNIGSNLPFIGMKNATVNVMCRTK